MPKLTKRLIDDTPFPSSGQVFLRDCVLRGFALRVTKGTKTFVLEKRVRGRVRRITIGPYGPLTVDQARKQAEAHVGAIAQGEDPAQARQDRIKEPTFGDLALLYEQRHLPMKRSARDDRSMLDTHLKELKTRKLSDISRNEIVLLHSKIGETAPYRANRAVALLRKMFNLAKDWGMFQGENPATRIHFFKEKERDRFVRPDEFPRLFAAILEEPDEYVRGAFFTYLFTGARREEVLAMRWEDISLEQAEWRIPQTKADRPHVLPLAGPLLAVLSKLPRQDGNPYVFAGRKGSHRVNIKRAWGRIRTKGGVSDVRLHDLRRTVGSWLAGSGESLQLIGAVLNHSNISTTRIYARLDLDPLRRALEQNASKMLLTVHKHFQRKEGRKHGRGSIPTPSLPALQRLVSAATN
ncbi:MAG: tyrosine-type recombinase/integrase [Candidatus Binatia bacterium]